MYQEILNHNIVHISPTPPFLAWASAFPLAWARKGSCLQETPKQQPCYTEWYYLTLSDQSTSNLPFQVNPGNRTNIPNSLDQVKFLHDSSQEPKLAPGFKPDWNSVCLGVTIKISQRHEAKSQIVGNPISFLREGFQTNKQYFKAISWFIEKVIANKLKTFHNNYLSCERLATSYRKYLLN